MSGAVNDLFPMSEMLSAVESWSAIPSGSVYASGLERLAEKLQQDFQRLPTESSECLQLRATNGGFRPLLLFRQRTSAPCRLLLFGHFDTVYGSEVKPTIRSGDRLIGPGVLDMKGGLSILLWGLAAFEHGPAEKRIGWTVALNSDEELGSPDSGEVFQELATEHRYGFGFEPALPNGAIASARRGSGNFRFTFRGKAAHSGRNPQAGKNALLPLARFILRTAALNRDCPDVFINPAVVNAGSAVNVVPDQAVCDVNVRTNKPEDEDWIRNQFTDFVRSEARDFPIEFTGRFGAPPKPETPASRRLVELVQLAGTRTNLELEAEPTGGSCDGNRLAALGVPNIDNLGARGNYLHSPEEYLEIGIYRNAPGCCRKCSMR
jgi:glutamate carboxypeptidase